MLDPASSLDLIGTVLLRHGRIAAVGPDVEAPAEAEILDATGLVVTPGFVDPHVHLRFPGFPRKEDIASGTGAAAAGGYTTVCAMANTDPVVDTVEVLEQVVAEARRAALVRVRQLAAVTRGLRGHEGVDMEALRRAGAVAFSDDGRPVWNAAVMEEALREAARLDAVLSVHEEDPAIVRGGVANAGGAAERLELPPWPCAGEASMVRRDIDLVARTGGRLHVAHVSCAGAVLELRRARALGLPVTAEVTPHHLRLDDGLLAGDPVTGLPPRHPCVKVNPPLRSPEDVEAVVAALADGTIDAVATDHAPHTEADKSGDFETAAFGFTGSEMALSLVLDLVRENRLTLMVAVERLTQGPARVFGLDAGTLRIGGPGDVCLFDPERRWTVDVGTLRSRGKNTPLLGRTLRGRVIYTVVAGQTVYSLHG